MSNMPFKLSGTHPLNLKKLSGQLRLGVLLIGLGVLGACSVYRPTVTQGNIVSAEQLSTLRQGMSRQQVQQTLGSPLLQDVFNANRWDYVYRVKQNDAALEQRALTLFFDASNRLTRWDAQGYTNNPSANATANTVAAAPLMAMTAPPALTSALVPPPKPTPASVGANVIVDTSPAPSLIASPVLRSQSPTPVAAPVVTPVREVALRVSQASVKAPTSETNKAIVKETVQPKPTLIDTYDSVEKKIGAWKNAWVNRDYDAYISHYEPSYKGDTVSASAWQTSRKRVLAVAGNIELTLSDVKIALTSTTQARASFTQSYKSSTINETGQKQLFFQRFGDDWKIVGESFSK